MVTSQNPVAAEHQLKTNHSHSLPAFHTGTRLLPYYKSHKKNFSQRSAISLQEVPYITFSTKIQVNCFRRSKSRDDQNTSFSFTTYFLHTCITQNTMFPLPLLKSHSSPCTITTFVAFKLHPLRIL